MLLAAALANATTCSWRPPPVVMGGASPVIVPPVPELHVTWRVQPEPWPPVLVLANAPDEHVEELAAYDTVPLRSVEVPPRVAGARERSVVVTPARPLAPGTSWRLYAKWPDLGWLGRTELHVVPTVPEPAWVKAPRVRTGPADLARTGRFELHTYNDLTPLHVPADATDAAYLAAWEGRLGVPIDYDRPPDFVAPREAAGFRLGSYVYCEPRILAIPATGGDDRVYGIRPIDTQGRRGPAVEVALAEARANERADRRVLEDAALAVCRAASREATAAWQAAANVATGELLAAMPGCVAWIDEPSIPMEFQACVGTPVFDRARLVGGVATSLREARSIAEALGALRAGAQLPLAWGPERWAALDACAAVPDSASGAPP